MSILIIAPRRETGIWKKSIGEIDPSINVEIYPEVADKEKITAAVLWNHPEGVLNDYPNLKWVTSLGAGVDHVLKDKNIPERIRITRIIDPGIPVEMARMIVTMLTEFEKGIFKHWENKKTTTWKPSLNVPKFKIGLLGMGEIGRKIADVLETLNYSVTGYSLHGKRYKNFNVYGKDQLEEFLREIDVLVCLLPLTSQTDRFIDKKFLSLMKEGSYIMNLARGRIINDEDLLDAIEKGIIKKVYLDVFEKEPLPEGHPFWRNPWIIITPHISGITDVHTAAQQIVDNYHTFENSGELKFEIDKQNEY